jgi:PAS domain S-box-containing protein
VQTEYNNEPVHRGNEHRSLEDILRLRSELLQTILDHVPVMISVFDAAGRIRLVNHHWENVFGWTLSEARLTDVIATAFPDLDYRREVLDFVANPTTGWRNFKPRARDGRVIETSWMLVPLLNEMRVGFGLEIVCPKASDSPRVHALGDNTNHFVSNMDPYTRLTPRQLHVLRLVAEGRRTKEIASTLNISVKTVEVHRSRLMAALGIHDIPGLVRYAIRMGLISADA